MEYKAIIKSVGELTELKECLLHSKFYDTYPNGCFMITRRSEYRNYPRSLQLYLILEIGFVIKWRLGGYDYEPVCHVKKRTDEATKLNCRITRYTSYDEMLEAADKLNLPKDLINNFCNKFNREKTHWMEKLNKYKRLNIMCLQNGTKTLETTTSQIKQLINVLEQQNKQV